MALLRKRLCAVNPTASTDVIVYTVPTNTATVISSINVTNPDGAGRLTLLYHLTGSETPVAANKIYHNTISATSTTNLAIGICMIAGDKLVINTAGSNIGIVIWGEEEMSISNTVQKTEQTNYILNDSMSLLFNNPCKGNEQPPYCFTATKQSTTEHYIPLTNVKVCLGAYIKIDSSIDLAFCIDKFDAKIVYIIGEIEIPIATKVDGWCTWKGMEWNFTLNERGSEIPNPVDVGLPPGGTFYIKIIYTSIQDTDVKFFVGMMNLY